jgi:hypothetical protein
VTIVSRTQDIDSEVAPYRSAQHEILYHVHHIDWVQHVSYAKCWQGKTRPIQGLCGRRQQPGRMRPRVIGWIGNTLQSPLGANIRQSVQAVSEVR